MDWFDYLEDATCTVQNNYKASKIRRELLTHLEAITEELVAQGWSSTDARQEAINRMGPPNNVAIGVETGPFKGFHPFLWIVTWMGLAIGVFGMIFVNVVVHPLRILLFVGLTALSVFVLTLLQVGRQPDLESRWNTLVNMLRPSWYCFLVAGIVGILGGSKPIWFFFLPFHRIETLIIFIIMVLTGVAVVSRFIGSVRTFESWSPGMVALGMGVCYGVFSMTTVVFLRWLIPPTNPLVHWFGRIYIQENLLYIALYSIAVWLPSIILTVGSRWLISQLRVKSFEKTLS
jgi:hypothetical protein